MAVATSADQTSLPPFFAGIFKGVSTSTKKVGYATPAAAFAQHSSRPEARGKSFWKTCDDKTLCTPGTNIEKVKERRRSRRCECLKWKKAKEGTEKKFRKKKKDAFKNTTSALMLKAFLGEIDLIRCFCRRRLLAASAKGVSLYVRRGEKAAGGQVSI